MQLKIEVRGEELVEQELQRFVDRYTGILQDEILANIRPRTPIDSGQARRGWRKEDNRVVNRVPYIQRLEQGWSKQAPRGFVNQSIKTAIRNTNRRMS